jgi:hypothetical protein
MPLFINVSNDDEDGQDEYDRMVDASLAIEKEANLLGNEGWELVGITSLRSSGFMLAFRRPAEV